MIPKQKKMNAVRAKLFLSMVLPPFQDVDSKKIEDLPKIASHLLSPAHEFVANITVAYFHHQKRTTLLV
jgi:hypothetical protein